MIAPAVSFLPTATTTMMFRAARSARRALASLPARRLATAAPSQPSGQHGHLPTSQSAITSKLHFFNSVMGEDRQIPTYRVLGGDGSVLEGAEVPEVRGETACRADGTDAFLLAG